MNTINGIYLTLFIISLNIAIEILLMIELKIIDHVKIVNILRINQLYSENMSTIRYVTIELSCFEHVLYCTMITTVSAFQQIP